MFAVLKKIGEYGPLILLLCSIFLLRNKYNLLFYYILFFGISIVLNIVLKGLIQQPRPSIDAKTFQLMMKNKERYISKHGMPYDIFGMPSGHSQSVLFSTVFIYFCLRDFKVLLVYIIVSSITLCQRVIDNHHSVMQVIVGSSIGIVLGYIAYFMAKNNIEGKKTAKKDDYGPL
uniref:Phosphatidic acid phosphatase type 2/haloperoxidase domain-containing protein n=1 Tax=viral metagenome TaxID=1070528 RepID=A0A6C0DSZ8_9ZZZZ